MKYVNLNFKDQKHRGWLTIALAEIGWKKLLMISAKVCALTFALPTMVGSRCIHFSQLLQILSIAGTLASGRSHLLSL